MGILEILGLNLGNLNVSVSLGQRSALCNDTVLHRRSPVLLPRDEDVVGLRESVITARNIVEETIDVPTPELEDILAKLRDLESQVENLLGDDGDDAVKVTTTTENAQSESEPASAANNGEAGNNIDSDGTDQQEAENGEHLAPLCDHRQRTSPLTRNRKRRLTRHSGTRSRQRYLQGESPSRDRGCHLYDG